MVEIDMSIYNEAFPYFAESLMQSGLMAKDVETLYAKDKAGFYKLYKDYEAHTTISLFKTGTLARELRLKHCLGVLLAAEEDENFKAKLLKKYEVNYQQLFILAKKSSAKLFDCVVAEADSPVAQSNAAFRLGYYFLVLTHGSHFEAPEQIIKLIHILEDDIIKRRVYNHLALNLENGIRGNIESVSKIAKEYQAVRSCSDIRAYMDRIDSQRNSDSFPPAASLPFQEAIRDVYSLMGALLDSKDMSFSLLLESHSLNKKELQTIAYFIHQLKQTDIKYKNMKNETDKYAYFYITGIVMLSIIKEYSAAKKLCNDNLSEEVLTENQALSKTIEQLHAQVRKLQEQINNHSEIIEQRNWKTRQEIKSLDAAYYDETQRVSDELKELRREKQQWEQDKYDWDRLKELAYDLKDETDNEPQESPDINGILQKHKIFVFGGHENWHKQLKNTFPDICTVSGTLHSVDPEIFQSADYVLIFSGHMAHTVYDKVTDYLRKRDIPYVYLPQCNFRLVAQRIATVYEEKMKNG